MTKEATGNTKTFRIRNAKTGQERDIEVKPGSIFVTTGDEFVTNQSDNVNNPTHYNRMGIECIKAIEASMSPEEFKGYLKGNVEKYVWRYAYKNGVEDLEKAQVYLGWLIERGKK